MDLGAPRTTLFLECWVSIDVFFLFAPDYYLWRISQGTNRRCIFQVVASRSGLSGGLISAVTQSCDDLTKFRLYVITVFF